MGFSVVIDTNIFIEICNVQENFWECLPVISKIKEGKIIIAVDTNGDILKEYLDALKKNMNNPIAKIILELIKKEIYKQSGPTIFKSYVPVRLNKLRPLINMGFHNDDVKFVRIANQTDLMTIISIDSRSFFSDNYASWIRDNLSVDAMRPCSFIAFFSNLV